MTIEQMDRIADEMYSKYEENRSGSNFNQDSYRTHLYGFISELLTNLEITKTPVPADTSLVTILHTLIY